MLDIALLKQHHFTPTGDKITLARKVHENIFLEYDTTNGFVTIVRFLERPKHNKDSVTIVFPYKIDTEQKLLALSNLFTGNFNV